MPHGQEEVIEATASEAEAKAGYCIFLSVLQL